MSFSDRILSLFPPTDNRPLSFLRIATPLVALVELLTLWPGIQDIYGSQGYLEWVVSNQLFSVPNLPTMGAISELINHPWVTDTSILYIVMGAYMLSLLVLLSGYKTSWAALFAWMLHLTINNSANMYGYGVETFIHVSLFYLIFMPSDYYRPFFFRNRKAAPAGIYPAVWLFILRVHLCLVYLNAGLAKLEGEDWVQGEAIWRSVAQPSYGQFDMLWLADWPLIAVVATWSVLVLETAYPLFIWWKRARFIWWLGIVMMHVGIGLLMGLHAFAAIMIVMNTAAFGWPFVEAASSKLSHYWRSTFKGKSKVVFGDKTLRVYSSEER